MYERCHHKIKFHSLPVLHTHPYMNYKFGREWLSHSTLSSNKGTLSWLMYGILGWWIQVSYSGKNPERDLLWNEVPDGLMQTTRTRA
ncbi:uncharacterized protein Bfra_011841 [Botrytis fragariae]|uniref:Uncharacterized protein n=1 Tax=Botrytis fragariae TaxID=1964551 RepID=A0A8H6EE57_9HELO|nr:uncharacterized protein Bfra_011841 [Botrytis fragariae]KAF5868876.1 hypothetical protein Bfra_011841 [Botrytis fragariae]